MRSPRNFLFHIEFCNIWPCNHCDGDHSSVPKRITYPHVILVDGKPQTFNWGLVPLINADCEWFTEHDVFFDIAVCLIKVHSVLFLSILISVILVGRDESFIEVESQTFRRKWSRLYFVIKYWNGDYFPVKL